MKLTVSQLLFRACIQSHLHSESIMDAYGNNQDEEVVREAADYLKQLGTYMKKRWGAK